MSFSEEIALKNQRFFNAYSANHQVKSTVLGIIIIMVIFRCYFSREHIALSYKNGVNIELGKTNRLKALRIMENHA